MKIAINQKPISGPWGGGNQFLASLIPYLKSKNVTIVHTLEDPDIDLILMIDPRMRNKCNLFLPRHIIRYKLRHPSVVVVHRINENDERKGTKTVNMRLKIANLCADHTIFIASWLKDLKVWKSKTIANASVILNGANTDIFNSRDKTFWNHKAPIKIVTHHWGGNYMKGFDIYEQLDNLLKSDAWHSKIHFTYIGNVPKGFKFKHATHLNSLSGKPLAAELKKHDIYVTGSQFEPAGMHHIEAALCGLPLLYRNSGALPEYCAGYGVEFTGCDDFEAKLKVLIENYDTYVEKLSSYKNTAENMCEQYYNCFNTLVASQAYKSPKKVNQILALLSSYCIW